MAKYSTNNSQIILILGVLLFLIAAVALYTYIMNSILNPAPVQVVSPASVTAVSQGSHPTAKLLISPSSGMSINQNLTITVYGLTPYGSWVLYTASGMQLTQPHPLDASGNGVLIYNYSQISPLYSVVVAGNGANVVAIDNNFNETNIVTVKP